MLAETGARWMEICGIAGNAGRLSNGGGRLNPVGLLGEAGERVGELRGGGTAEAFDNFDG